MPHMLARLRGKGQALKEDPGANLPRMTFLSE